jgi:hypothetical protein
MERITSTLEGAVLVDGGVVPAIGYHNRVEVFVFDNGSEFEIVFRQGDGTDWMEGSIRISRGIGPTLYWAAMMAWVNGSPDNLFVFERLLETLKIEPDRPGHQYHL